jgi:hypothetical protein
MTLATTDPASGMRRGGIRWPNGNPPNPDGCRWCGVAEREHCGRWTNGAGWHQWTQPTSTQRLARMRARRAKATR